MLRIAIAWLVAGSTTALAQLPPPPPPVASLAVLTQMPPADIARAKLAAEMAALEREGFSGLAGVEVGGQMIWQGAAGLADPKRNVRFQPGTQVPIMSLTKPFTAAAILKLQDERKLSVNDRVSRFFPQEKGPLAAVTIQQLLTHSSGLPIFASSKGDSPDAEPVDRAAFLKRVFATKLEFKPGQKFSYSNAGYSLLAAIVELSSGRPYADYIREKIVAPAGVSAIGYAPDVKAGAAAHNRDGKSVDELSWGRGGPYWNLIGNGGFLVEPSQFIRWRRAFLDGRVVSKDAVKASGTRWIDGPGTAGEGYGWIVGASPTRGRVEVAAGGDNDFTAEMRYYRDLDLIIFTATNGARPVGIAAGRLLNALLGESVPVQTDFGTPGERALMDRLAEALSGDAPAARRFIDSNAGPRFVERVGIEQIERRFEDIRKGLAGAAFVGRESTGPATAVLRFRLGDQIRRLEIIFGGSPEAPRLAGFELK